MNFFYLNIIFPLIGFLLLSFSQNTFSKRLISCCGIIPMILSLLISCFSVYNFFYKNIKVINIKLWNWINIENINIDIGLTLDGLSLVITIIINFVGLLVHIFSTWYMAKDHINYSRFFAYTNLFIANMLLLILADNFALMYIGWEGVGVCSYLLIGFYYHKEKNCNAALKAFLITRFGDILLLIALFILLNEYHTLDFSIINNSLTKLKFINKQNVLNIITIMLFFGAIGKSAQIPLHGWLSNAMVGPTPVSALIHSSTMVIAGVYLIARNYYLFSLTPYVLYFISIISIITMLLSSLAALVQYDIKKILAYSTISQISYMFLSLGMQSWESAIFHLVTHAFFKSSLFLISGIIILKCCNEQNIFKIGKIIKQNFSFLYICFLISSLSLSSFPILTSGFFSKGKILLSILDNKNYSFLILSLIGSLLTTLYIFRMILIIFHSSQKNNNLKNLNSGLSFSQIFPVSLLTILSTFIVIFIPLPLNDIFPIIVKYHSNKHVILEILSSFITILGILIAIKIWILPNKYIKIIKNNEKIMHVIFIFCSFLEWSFEKIYKCFFVNIYFKISSFIKQDPLNKINNFIILIFYFINKKIKKITNGYIRFYIFITLLSIMIFLLIKVFS